MKYRCRVTKPSESRWYEVEADSPEAAASEYHYSNLDVIPRLSWEMKDDGGIYFLMFSCVEVEGFGELVARTYKYGIFRRGGVKRIDHRTTEQKLRELADALGWTKDPAILIEPGWEGEEEPS